MSRYYRALSTQGAGNRVSELDVLLGYSETDEGKIPFRLPQQPPADVYYVKPWDFKKPWIYDVEYSLKPKPGWILTEVLNHGLPVFDQIWKPPVVPEFWDEEYLADMADRNGWVTRRAGRNIPDIDRFRDSDNQTPEQYDFAVREWHRRAYGVWIWIGGNLTYLTGFHYYYGAYFSIDTGLPDYRDRDRRWFYAAQGCMHNPQAMGILYLKHRRDGATYRCCAIGLCIASMGYSSGAHFGIVSKDKDSAEEAFQNKTVVPFNSLPFFFRPMVRAAEDVQKILEFKAPPRSQSERHLAKKKGLNSSVQYRAPGQRGKAGFDGGKMAAILMDEIAKKPDVDIMDELSLLAPALTLDGIFGFMMVTSTNEELEGINKDKFRTMFDLSNPRLGVLSESKATPTNLLHYFTPASDGLNKAWIGRFGESIEGKPTDSQLEHLMSMDRETVATFQDHWVKGGARDYILMVRRGKADPLSETRKFPLTPEESFSSSNEKSDFNMGNLNRLKNELMDAGSGMNNRFMDLTIRGRLEWVGKIFKGDVYFVPDDKGNFLVNREYLPIQRDAKGFRVIHKGESAKQWGGDLAARLKIYANNIIREPARQGRNEKWGTIIPKKEDSWIVIGMDPVKVDADDQRDKRLSKASSHGFYPYNPMVDGPWTGEIESNIGFAEEWESHAFVFHYLNHPKSIRDHHEDMLKAAIFWNARILYERNANEFGHYMREIGADSRRIDENYKQLGDASFMIYDRAWAKDKSKSVPGFHSDETYIRMGITRLKAWIDHHCYAKRCPFPELVDQWMRFERAKITLFDAVVSSYAALLAAQPEELRRDEKFDNLQPEDDTPAFCLSDLYTLYR